MNTSQIEELTQVGITLKVSANKLQSSKQTIVLDSLNLFGVLTFICGKYFPQ